MSNNAKEVKPLNLPLIENIKTQYEFDQSGNEQTFYFKEFVQQDESSNLPQIQKDIEKLKTDFKGLEEIKERH